MCPQFAIVLSGCGVYDGSEIHEAVTTLLALDKAGAGYKCFAPNIPQAKTIVVRIGTHCPRRHL